MAQIWFRTHYIVIVLASCTVKPVFVSTVCCLYYDSIAWCCFSLLYCICCCDQGVLEKESLLSVAFPEWITEKRKKERKRVHLASCQTWKRLNPESLSSWSAECACVEASTGVTGVGTSLFYQRVWQLTEFHKLSVYTERHTLLVNIKHVQGRWNWGAEGATAPLWWLNFIVSARRLCFAPGPSVRASVRLLPPNLRRRWPDHSQILHPHSLDSNSEPLPNISHKRPF